MPLFTERYFLICIFYELFLYQKKQKRACHEK